MLDRIRALYPHLSIGVYALDPGGAVTVEAITPDGSRFTKTAPTADEAFTAIFGPLPDDQPETTNSTTESTAHEQPVDPFS